MQVLILATLLAAQIDGHLIHALTNKPIPRANVQVLDPADGRRVAETTSNAEGAFHFENLPTGRYKLTTQQSRFVPYAFNGILDLQADTKIEALTLKLTPASALNGRVVDSDGDPLQNAQIMIYRATPFFGEEYWLPMGGGISDDRGVFRVAGIAPGRYLLAAKKQDSAFRTTYYPNASVAADAQPLQVRIGEDWNDLLLTLPLLKAGVIRGTFPTPIRAWIIPEPPPEQRRIPFQRDDSFPIHPQSGAFEISGLSPGNHRFHVFSSGAGQPSRIIATGEASLTGQDIENFTFQPVTHATLGGKLSYEGPTRPTARIVLTYPEFGRNTFLPPVTPNAADGVFTIENIHPGRYRLLVDLGKSKAFVKSIRQGDREILGQPIDVTASAQDPLHIIISSKVATLSGKVELSDPSIPPGVILMEPLDRKPEITATIGSRFPLPPINQHGAYEVPNLAPGRYRVYALEAIHPNDAYDPNLLKHLAPLAIQITLAEGETKQLNLKQIPAAQVQAALHQQ